MADGESTIEFPAEVVMVKMQPYPRKSLHFFYRRPDGSIIDLGEHEAAMAQKHSRKFQLNTLLGCSDGSAMIEYLRSRPEKPGKLIPYKTAQEIMRKANEIELEAAKGNIRYPRLSEWVYPDNSVPAHERR